MDTISNNFMTFLTNYQWISEEQEHLINFYPPKNSNMYSDTCLSVLKNDNHPLIKTYCDQNIKTLSQLLSIDYNELYTKIVKDKYLFRNKLSNNNTISLKTANTIFEESKQIILCNLNESTDKYIPKNNNSHFLDEYMNNCLLQHTQRGSFIINIEIPNKLVVIDSPFIDKVFAFDINKKLDNSFKINNTLSLVENKKDFAENRLDDFISNNIENISVPVLTHIQSLYKTINDENGEITLSDINSTNVYKLSKIILDNGSFVKDIIKEIDRKINNIPLIDIDLNRVIVTKLLSTDPSKDDNYIHVMEFSTNPIYKEIIVKLNSVEYHKAIKAHDLSSTCSVKGKIKKTGKVYVMQELHSFQVNS